MGERARFVVEGRERRGLARPRDGERRRGAGEPSRELRRRRGITDAMPGEPMQLRERAHDDEAARTSEGATHVEFRGEPSSPVASDEHPGDGQPVTNGASFEGRDATPTARPERDS